MNPSALVCLLRSRTLQCSPVAADNFPFTMGLDNFAGSAEPRRETEEKIPQSRLEEARRGIENITDGLGKPIDAGIREPVAVLNALGINTTGSCEGHLDRGSPVPYIDIEAPDEPSIMFEGEEQKLQELAQKYSLEPAEIREWPQDEERDLRARQAYDDLMQWIREVSPEYTPAYQKWLDTDDRYRAAFAKLLEEFYATRPAPDEGRLIIQNDRLRTQSHLYDRYLSEALDGRPTVWSPDETEQLGRLLPACQAEMRAFVDFLKDRFIDAGAER